MRPLFFCGYPINFPILDGVFYHIVAGAPFGHDARKATIYKNKPRSLTPVLDSYDIY